MKDVAALLRKYLGDDLELFVRELEDAPTTQGNLLWREFVNRIRKAAGIAPRPAPERGGLLELLEREEKNLLDE